MLAGVGTADRELSAAAAALVAEALAPNTRRAYRRWVTRWDTWCASAGRTPLPGTPESLASWVAELVAEDQSPASIGQVIVRGPLGPRPRRVSRHPRQGPRGQGAARPPLPPRRPGPTPPPGRAPGHRAPGRHHRAPRPHPGDRRPRPGPAGHRVHRLRTPRQPRRPRPLRPHHPPRPPRGRTAPFQDRPGRGRAHRRPPLGPAKPPALSAPSRPGSRTSATPATTTAPSSGPWKAGRISPGRLSARSASRIIAGRAAAAGLPGRVDRGRRRRTARGGRNAWCSLTPDRAVGSRGR